MVPQLVRNALTSPEISHGSVLHPRHAEILRGGQTRIGMIRPEAMLASLSADPSLKEVARAEEAATKAIIEAAAA